MPIRKSELKDLPAIEEIYACARVFMKQNGNPGQWGDNYPPKELLLEDIASGRSYIYEEENKTLAAFCFYVGQDPTYARIEGAWLNAEPYGVIHRFAVLKRGAGLGAFCFDWCFKQCRNLRIDTHKNNKPMLALINKSGFSYCGIIYTRDATPRLAFQKTF